MMASSPDVSEPVCLVQNTEDGKLCVNEEAVHVLEKITQPVVVVAVVGLYCTGKSYLLNRLAGKYSKHNGFAVGSTKEPKTKGIWMWCVPHPLKDNHTLVLLDTEGLAFRRSSPPLERPNFRRERQQIIKGDENHDTWMFSLAALLSSTLVYNSRGTIDSSAVEKLHSVAAKLISGAGTDPSLHVFPSLVWTVRDFTQHLELEGNQITDDDYLEEVLALKNGNTDDIKLYNLLRSKLLSSFAVRKCFVFQWPVSDSDKMDCLEKLLDSDLNSHFVEKANEFCDYIVNESKAKTMKGELKLTGRMLASLADMYITALNSGQIPCVEKAVETLTHTHSSQAVAEAVGTHQTENTTDEAEGPHQKETHFRETNGEDEVRIVLLGKTGVGKSSTGNTLLGEEVFEAACSQHSQTQICQRREKVINGRKIVVVDTPGILDTYRSEEEINTEIISSLVECAPGPHVFILVMKVERFTRENQEAVQKVLESLSGDAVHHMVLLFTHGDDLEENMTIHDFIDQCSVEGKKRGKLTLKDLAEKCGNRVHVIDNKYWNQSRFRDSASLADLQKLNLSEQALRDFPEMMPITQTEETPWFNVLSEHSDGVETESRDESEERIRTEYRSNRFQLTELMKSVRNILAVNNGRPYRNKELEAKGEAINAEVKNIQEELEDESESVNMVEIKRQARERVRAKQSECVLV